jgi:RNA-directed DNA polymerase
MSLLDEIMAATGLGSAELEHIIRTAPARYKAYPIPKRSGGSRIIAQPSREIKLLQRFVIQRVLSHYPVHSAAAAYVKGRNILDNAKEHVANRIILKLDFMNFFPSIILSDWRQLFMRSPNGLDARDYNVASRILFWGNGTTQPLCLSIGAPSSPMMSNILLFSLDTQIEVIAKDNDVSYTRYADDITLSGASYERVLAVEEGVRRAVAQLKSPKLAFNDEKRGLYSMGQRRMVTGLIITPEAKISLGRSRKRMMSSLIHKYTQNALSIEEIGKLKGFLGFAQAVEPSFVESMRKKYGRDTVQRIMRTHIPKRTEARGGGDFIDLT